MSGIPFFRLTGCGNDFLAFAEPANPPTPDQVRAWCRRGVSLGADGVFVVARAPPDPGDLHPLVRMRYWNADGGEADLCLNGGRCAARLAFDLGWAQGQLLLATGAGVFAARDAGAHAVALAAPVPAAPPRRLELSTSQGPTAGDLVIVGVPHLVVVWPGALEQAPEAALGEQLRHHPHLRPAGANDDFVRWLAPDRLEIRTFERGVEAETLACGTGVLAAAFLGVATGQLALPLRVATRGGFALRVQGVMERGRIESWSLEGDARLLARGELFAAAEASSELGCRAR